MTPARRKLLLISVLLVCAAAVAWDRLRVRSVPISNDVVRPSVPRKMSSVATTAPNPGIAVLRPRTDYVDGGADAFAPLLPPAPIVAVAPTVAVAAPRPMAPALPFTVVGKKLERGNWEVYLARGDHIYIATQGSVIGDDYRVTAITPAQLTLIYLPLNETQTLQTGASFND